MQKFCIWETGYKIPKLDCIKLRCKNSASGNWIQNTENWLHQATVSVKIVRTLLCLLVPPMLVYTIWWLNRNKQHWEGKGKHKKGKKIVFALSVPTTAVFVSGTVGLSLEWLWEVKKKRKKEKKKETRFLKFNIHKNARVVTKISNCRVNTTSRGEIRQLGISFGSIFLLFSYESIWRKSPAPAS